MLDVDSTLIQQEVIELLAEHAGVMPEVRRITDLAMRGELDFEQSLRQRVSLLEGLSTEIFNTVRSQITFTDGARELVDAVHSSGGKVGAVSGGFIEVLDGLAVEIGLDYWRANRLEKRSGKLTGQVDGELVDAKAKAKALRTWAALCELGPDQTVAVGDGANDIEMLQAAGYAIAFRPKPVLRQYADFIIEENSLLPVIQKIPLGSG